MGKRTQTLDAQLGFLIPFERKVISEDVEFTSLN